MGSGSPVAVVTGSSRGIGRGIAVELSRAGWSVLINYASDEKAAAECKRLCLEAAPSADSGFETIQADISKAEDRSRLLSAAQRFGRVDLLVNNAGVSPEVRADLLEMREESLNRLLAINLKGPLFLTQMFCNWWLGAQNQAGGARLSPPKIVFISSVSAYAASVNRGDYCVTKAAVSMLTRLFAVRLADHGINVYEIRPGVIASDMTRGTAEKYDRMIADGLTPIRRWGRPEDVGLAVRAIAEGRLPFSTGEVINVDGGFHLHRL